MKKNKKTHKKCNHWYSIHSRPGRVCEICGAIDKCGSEILRNKINKEN